MHSSTPIYRTTHPGRKTKRKMAVPKLDPKLWRHLPAELLAEHVLRWLPFSTLCRFRVVCKYWNSLPALHRGEPYLLDIPCNSPLEDPHAQPCYLYSPLTNIWSQIDLSFVFERMSPPYPFPDWTPQVDRYCSDGGLLCLWVKYMEAFTRRPHVLDYGFFVVNPVSRRSKFLIAAFECEGYDPRDIVMRRESSGRYQIFACDTSSDSALRVVMYNSGSHTWKVLCTFERRMQYECSIVFGGVFYCLLQRGTREIYDLFAYDIAEGAWIAYGVEQDSSKPGSVKIKHFLLRSAHCVSFVVSNSSLHLVASGWDEWKFRAYFSAHKLDMSNVETVIASSRCVPRDPKSVGTRSWIWGAIFEYGNRLILASDAKRRVAGVDIFSWAADVAEEYVFDLDDLPENSPPRCNVHPNGLKPIIPLVKRPRLGSNARYYGENMKKVTFDMQAIP